MDPDKNWFEKWFDSPYYHVLYRHRDLHEAELFIGNLTKQLHLPAGARVLDMACGKGRHSVLLNRMGFDVTGIDISEQSIMEARGLENDTLAFYIHDMRRLFRVNYFDCVLNLFTSFGYFHNTDDNLRVVRNAHDALKPGGCFVLDFMNTPKVIRSLVPEESKTIEGITFRVKKYVREGFIFKEIFFSDRGEDYFFTERVQALTADELKNYFEHSGLKVVNLWGGYELGPFDEENSDRLIIAGRKE